MNWTSATAEGLRRAFDESFAGPRSSASAAAIDLLAIRIAGDPFAIRASQIEGLFSGRQIVPLPTPVREMLGVAGFRGVVVPAFGLRLILGYPPAPGARWTLLAGGADRVALAFDDYQGHLRVGPELFAAPEAAGEHVHEVVRTGEIVRAVIDIASVIGTIKKRVRLAALPKER